MTRVLIAHASIGSGHKAAARAILDALVSSHPDWELAIVDTVETSEVTVAGETLVVEPPRSARDSKTAFLRMREAMPRVTGAVVDAGDKEWSVTAVANGMASLANGIRSRRGGGTSPPPPPPPSVARSVGGRVKQPLQRATGVVKPGVAYLQNFMDLLNRVHFDLVISTHFYSAHALAIMKDRKMESVAETLSFVVVTDYHAHKTWKCRHVDKYFLPASQVETEIVGWFPLSGPERKPPTVISGIPASPKIGTIAKMDKCELRKSLGLPHGRASKVVLATLTSENIADCKLAFSRVVAWAGENPNHFVVLIAGRLARERLEKDESGRKKLAKNNGEALDDAARQMAQDLPNVLAVGFTSKMAEYMHASDIILSKPGGLTVAESLSFGLPWIIVKPWLLDVEKPNAAYLQKMEITRLVDRVSDLDSALRYAVGGKDSVYPSDGWLAKAQESARSLGNPEAAMILVRSAEANIMENQRQ